MSKNLTVFVTVLKAYAADRGERESDTLHDTLVTLRSPGTPLEQATLVEDLARATWRVLVQDGVSLPIETPYYFLARPYDDGEARLVICTATQVILNDLWPTAGPLRDWYRAINNLAETLQDYATSLLATDDSPLLR